SGAARNPPRSARLHCRRRPLAQAAAPPPGGGGDSLGYERASVDTHRTVLVGDQAMAVSGGHTDTTLSARLEAGREVYAGVTPFVAAGWIRHRQGALHEAGGQGLELRADADASEVRYGELGLRLRLVRDRLSLHGLAAGRWLSGDTDAGFPA